MSWLSNLVTGDDDKRRADDAAKYAQQLEDQRKQGLDTERARRRTTALAGVGNLRAPTQTDATKRRISALEEESKPGALVADPEFQAQRATLVQGGQQALSGVQNTQRTTGATGGFSNQGSIADVYDRLGGQLSQLGQQSNQLKQSKAKEAADMQQSYADAVTDFQNNQEKMRSAIESGDSDLAMEYMNRAYDAQQKISQNYRQAEQQAISGGYSRLGKLAGGAIQGGAMLMGGMPGAPAAPSSGGDAGYFSGSYEDTLKPKSQPWSLMGGRR